MRSAWKSRNASPRRCASYRVIARCGYSCLPAPVTASLSRVPMCASSGSSWRPRRAPCVTMLLPKQLQSALREVPQPVIAMIQGHAVGSGTIVAASCDFRIAVRTAKFGIPVAKFGFIAPVPDTLRLVQLVGPAKAKWLLMTGQLIEAPQAQAIGLIDEVVEPAQLKSHVESLAVDPRGECPADDKGNQTDHRNNDGAERDRSIRRTLVCRNLPQSRFQGGPRCVLQQAQAGIHR